MSHAAPRRVFASPTRLADDPGVLVVFCHPQAHRSRVNRALVDAIEGLHGISVHDLYERYPDAGIDVPYEQGLLASHRAVVLQHPLYWYSTPPLLKEWIDVVFEWGWAYGPGGTKLRGKPLLQAITTGGAGAAYQPEGLHHYTIRELLAPMIATANLCGLGYREPFVVHGAHGLDRAGIAAAASAYRAALIALRDEVRA